MGVTFFGVASTPADNSSYESTASPAVVVPPANMRAGDLCIMLGGENIPSSSGSKPLFTRSGDGQTWHAGTFNEAGHGNQMFWCQFNGTWTVNPGVADNGAANSGGLSAILLVFRSSLASPAWAVDVAESDTLQASTATSTINGVTPVNPSNVTLAWWLVGFNITFSSLSAGWSYPGGISQWRNTATTSGQPITFSAGYKIQSSATATGNVSNTLSAAHAPWANIITFTDAPGSPLPAGQTIPRPGNPALSSPSNPLQFQGLSGYPPPPATIAPISGIWASTSVFYGPINSFAPQSLGFIPQPGPGNVGPFNHNQFLQTKGGYDNPSPTTLQLSGTFDGTSVFYGGSATTLGTLNGLWASSSTFLGNATGIAAGTTSGLFDGTSVFYGLLSGTGNVMGQWASSSLLSMRGIGGSFQPLVPMTAVVDVRLGLGYQPWSVKTNDNIG